MIIKGENITNKRKKIDIGKKGRNDILIFLKEEESLDLEINLGAPEAEADVFVAHLSKDGKASINLRVNHLSKGTKSAVKIRSVIFGKGRTDVSAVTDVRKNAKGSEVSLFSEAILLGDESSVSFIPSISTENNDVVISHGANTEIFDKEKIFYLSSRGMDKEEAVRVFIENFLSPLLSDEELSRTIRKYINIKN